MIVETVEELVLLIRYLFTQIGLGFVILCALLYWGATSAWTGFWERDVPMSQVSVQNINVDIPTIYPQMTTYVGATAEVTNNTTQKNLTQLDATLTLYDCPTAQTPVSKCDVLGRDSYSDDGPAEQGVPYLYKHQFDIPDTAKPNGVPVARLTFTGFQG